MSPLPQDIATAVFSPKRLLASPKWDDKSDRRYFVFTVPLEVIDRDFDGLELRAKVSKQHVARDAMMQLEFARGARDRTELVRCQWRPFEVHSNKAWGPSGYELDVFEQISHVHTFPDNYLPGENRMRSGSLPGAIPINPDATSLTDFLAICSTILIIKNMELVRIPDESMDMFWVPLDG